MDTNGIIIVKTKHFECSGTLEFFDLVVFSSGHPIVAKRTYDTPATLACEDTVSTDYFGRTFLDNPQQNNNSIWNV